MSLSGTRGVFSLRQIYNQQRKGTGYPIADVFTQRPSVPVPNVGYALDGRTGSTNLSLCQKTTYSDDTLARVPGGDAALGGAFAGATVCSETNQYKLGGQFPSGNPQSNTERFSFSTETCTYVPGANITEAKDYCAGVHNKDAGYRAGGSPGSTSTVVDKLTYSTETTVRVPSADLTAGHNFSFSGFSNNSVGYFSGGFASAATSLTTKLTFADDTSARTPSADLTSSRYASTAASNGSTIGYVAFGDGPKSSVDKFTYSSESYALAPTAQLIAAKKYGRGTSNGTAAYLMGGAPDVSYQQKISYSNDTRSSLPSSGDALAPGGIRLNYYGSPRQNALPSTTVYSIQQFGTGIQEGPNTAYFAGGSVPPTVHSTCDKFDLSTDTCTNVPNIALITCESGTSSTTTHGYLAGGHAGPNITNFQKLAYSTDSTTSIPGGNLTAGRYGVMGAGNQDVAFFTGGFNGSVNVSTTEKTTYSSDTTAAAPASLMPGTARRAGTKMGNQGAGYFSGGGPGGLTNTSKIAYSNEAQIAVPSADLIAGRYLLASTGTDTAGYAMGGFPTKSSTDKITWATETYQQLPAAPLSSARYGNGGIGNNNFAFSGGGGGVVSTIDKLNIASETMALSPATLTQARRYTNGVGARRDDNPQQPLDTPTSQTFPVPVPDAAPPITGYVTSGETSSGNVSSSQKLNMSTDEYSAVPSMNLPSAAGPSGYRTYASSASSPTNGYLMGGYAPNFSNAIKTTYLTETISAIPGSTSEARRSAAQGGGNSTRGYMAGGYSEAISPNGQVSNVDKLVYSSDTFGRQPGANLTEKRGGAGCVSNQSRMLTICGQPGPAAVTIVDRIDFASDTTDRIPGANDPTGRAYPRSNYYPSPERGYSSGGRNPSISTNYSLTTRFNFSDDTSSAVPGANMTITRHGHNACVGNTTHTYQSGGATPSKVSSTDKLNMSTETFAAAPSANLTAAAEAQSGYGPYMNGNPSANVPQAPNPTPNNC